MVINIKKISLIYKRAFRRNFINTEEREYD